METTNKELGKSVIWNTIGTMYYFASQWVITILVVRIGNYTLAGYLSLAMTITNTFYAIAQFGMRQFQVSDLNGTYSDGVYIGSRFISMFVAMLACIIYVGAGAYNKTQIACTISYMVLKLVEALVDVYQGIDQKSWRFDIIGKSFLIRGTILAIGFAVFLRITNDLSVTLLIITVLSLIVVIFFDIRLTKEFVDLNIIIFDRKIIKLFWECLPIVVFNFLLSVVTLIARNTLQDIEGVDALGIYSSVASPAVIIQLLASVIFNPFVPLFTRYFFEKKNKDFCKLLGKFCVFLLVLLIAAILLAKLLGKWALVLVLGSSIEPYVYLLIPVIGCTVVTAAIWLLSATLIAIRKTKSLVVSTIVAVVVCFGIAPKCIEQFSMNGVSYTVIISGMIQNVLMLGVCLFTIWRNVDERKDNTGI